MSSSSLFCSNCGAANERQATQCFACNRPLQANPAAESIVLKQRYRILQQLGQGGMGAVYIAEDTELGNRLLAIKEMSQRGLSQQEVEEATKVFKREALLLASLTHPNLPRIYDHFPEEGRWYLAMDFIEGETLENYVARTTGNWLPLKEVLDIGIQLCTVLEYLHTRQPPIIFRDLKPSNIMRTPASQLYLIDFGIARHFKPGQHRDTIALGSPGYAAPEQYGRTQTTPGSDIYSLGAILHQLLTGSDPTITPFFFASLSQEIAPPSMQILLNRMLAMNASSRPSSTAEIKQQLQHLAAQTYALLQKISHVEVGENNYAPASSASFAPPQMVGPSPYVLPPRRAPSAAGMMLGSYSGHIGSISALAWSPDGCHLASASEDKTVHIRDAISGEIIQIFNGHTWFWRSCRVQALAWSPQGEIIASAGDDHTVKLWEAVTGKILHTYREHSDKVLSVTWSPNGSLIASTSDTTIRVWDVNDGGIVAIYGGHLDAIQALAWSPDGIYLASGSRDTTVQVLRDSLYWKDVTWSKTVYRGHSGSIQALAWSPDGTRIASTGADRTVQVWDAHSGDHLVTYYGHARTVKAVAWSPDGKYIASAGLDETVQVWDAPTGDHFFTYRGHSSSVHAIAWSPDSTWIASGGDDSNVQIWRSR